MATCPECRVRFDDEVETCPDHGAMLVPDALVLPEDAPLPEGTMVGEYRIQHKLGAGTFGDVYAGEQPIIGKRVAVKVLNRRFASDPVMVSRFVAEARAVNKIRQRNIIDIFSFGVVPGEGRHYFVMELLDGMTLGALLSRTGRLPVALVLPIVRGIADALDAVHEAGITHRDLKPDNVFLARERDGTYFPKLLDFGIAKLLGEDVAHKTGSGMVLGTPRYMSPEQARGKKADHRADIYALGVMIHEMITGGPLFEGDSAVDMLLKQAVDDPPAMSEICPNLPRELDVPVLDMLHKRPADRPATAGKAVAALAACAKRLGLDRSETTLAELAADGTPTEQTAPKFAGTTVTVERKPSSPKRQPAGSIPDKRADPMSKTERAPASTPESAAPSPRRDREGSATLPSRAAQGATPIASEPIGPSGPTTESVSTLETSSAIRRQTRARRARFAAGAAVVGALGLAVWAFGVRAGGGAAATSSTPAVAIGEPPQPSAVALPTAASSSPIAPSVSAAAPVAKPEATPAPSADADAGAHARPTPTGHSTRPASSARNMDRILGDR